MPAKKASHERRCTLGEIIEEALRLTLVARGKSEDWSAFRAFKTFSGEGIRPGLELHSNAALEGEIEPN